MTDYVTHLDVKFDALEIVDAERLIRECTDDWYNQTLCRVNDSVVRLGVLQGEYHWHTHTEDEFFFVIDGRLLVDLEGRTVELAPRQGLTVPRGVSHRPRAPEKTVVVMVEEAGVIPTGS
ncbi:MAG TPA: cupin domain-containing protein [Candidatus Acidoferrales bacterium]|jgi:mannose-6-phosphate isomerase-like protein (cupin superfamily)|nr:cupin domain-containing protein [Candidatus Acidoferrales bacterium]